MKPGITEVIGSVQGRINGQSLSDVALMANISYFGHFAQVSLDVKNIPKPLVYLMRSVVSFLVPIYWAAVNQGTVGVNGISISEGSFVYEGQVSLSTRVS